ncbi:ATP-binding protein [Streptomyces sp. NPDC017940]|uniref:ATP-binding protein n=1 Tax=Streptomyces sp. NPDC017940 TaxID=3365017 RepID=UPI00379B32D3
MKKRTKDAGDTTPGTRKAPEPVRRDRSGLRLTGIVGNLTISRGGQVTAWYVAAPQRWSFLSRSDCNSLISGHAQRLAQLVGRRIHIRVTHRPYPVARWAAALDGSAHDPLPGWREYLAEEQQKVARLPLDDKVCYYGVTVGRITTTGLPLLRSSVDKQLAKLRRDIASIDNVMAGPGLDAHPAQAGDMDWLMTRSLGLCLPAPLHTRPQPTDVWNSSDLHEWTDGIQWTSPSPYSPHVLVAGTRNGRRVERHVAVLTFGRMNLPQIPESTFGPWLQRLDRLRFDYELSATIDIREDNEAGNEITRQLDQIRHQHHHHREHGVQPPVSLQRQSNSGQYIEDDINHGATGLSTRTRGWYRIAIAAADPEKLADRVQLVRELYQPSVLITHPKAQYALAREFIPCEPLSGDAYTRRMPVRTLGGSLPAVTAAIGDRSGFNLGFTSGVARRAVMWHPWESMEVREANGLTVVLGTQGSGKTVLGGNTVYHTARMGVPWILLDPSGPLKRLCELPELRPYSRAIDLMASEPGTLNPYRLLPEPDPSHYGPELYRGEEDPSAAADRAYQMDRRRTARTRNTLAMDVLMAMLPKAIAMAPETNLVITQALEHVDSSVHGSPREIISALRKLNTRHHEHAVVIADLLHSIAETPQGMLIFPEADGDDSYLTRHWRLVCFNLRGLALPSTDTRQEDWSVEERLAMPLLHLAAWYAQSCIYTRDVGERKGLLLDEAHFFQRVSSGRELLRKTGRDSRKHNARALLLSQDGQDAQMAGIENWIESVFVGRTVGSDAQRAALKLLNVPEGSGYEDMLAGLSPHAQGANRQQDREFIFRDGTGAVERITVPVRHRPALLDALDSTPGRRHAQQDANPWTQAVAEGLEARV